MSTQEQRAAVKQVCDAMTALNSALDAASSAGVFVELREMAIMSSRNTTYVLATSEFRETVLPG